MTMKHTPQIMALIRAAQAVCQSVNGTNPEATRRQHEADLLTLQKALADVVGKPKGGA